MIAARKIISARWFVLGAMALLQATAAEHAGVLAAHPLDSDHMVQWKLPSRLSEVSGLALTDDGRLFAMDDEKAAIYELDIERRRLVKAFALGSPILRGDFEGIAVVDASIYLISSAGDLFVASEGEDGEQVDFEQYDTGAGEYCEIEGLAAIRRHLLIVCKQAHGDRESLPILFWSLAEKTLDESATIELPMKKITAGIGKRRVNPSGIAVDPQTGNLLLVAARQHALIELTAEGKFIGALRLPMSRRHRQPEGIEIMQDGRLLIADEGGSHKPRLAVYRPGND